MISEKLQEFMNIWQGEKDAIYDVINNNRNGPRTAFFLSDTQSGQLLCTEIPNLLYNEACLLNTEFKIKGSIGIGNPSEIPWVGIFDLDITESAQSGFYIVYLFKSDMSGVYLSLNQGWTQYKNKFGINEGKAEISKNSYFAKALLKSDQGFSYDPIDLNAKNQLGKGYELGNICSVYYSSDSIPSEVEIINDLRNLIGVYRELKGVVGSDILEIQGKLDEDNFQEALQKGKKKELNDGPIPKKNKLKTSTSFSWARDANISFTALENAEFKCENDENHVTFISAKTHKQYVEAHHLIPMEYQDIYEYSIDVPENIISLCPNCHRKFHHSKDPDKQGLIERFFNSRISCLNTRNIQIDLVTLLKYYLCSHDDTI